MAIGVLTIQLQLPGCRSLKEKRRRIKPLITRLHREFNISVAEYDLQDIWDETTLACALISNQRHFTVTSLQSIVQWLNKNWPDVSLVDDHLEIIE